MVLKSIGPLEAEDFTAISREADASIEKHGSLKGLMIVAKEFPGWEDVQGFVAHLQFVWEHHKKIKKVAFVCESKFFEFVPRRAEVKHFDSNHETFALEWLNGS